MISAILDTYQKRDEAFFVDLLVRKTLIVLANSNKELLYFILIFILSSIEKKRERLVIYIDDREAKKKILLAIKAIIQGLNDPRLLFKIDGNRAYITTELFFVFKTIKKDAGQEREAGSLYILNNALPKKNKKELIGSIIFYNTGSNLKEAKAAGAALAKANYNAQFMYVFEGKYLPNLKTDFINHCEEIPPDINTFITDPFYLGKVLVNDEGECQVYSIWRRVLNEIYPDESSSTISELYLSGGIGLGKTTISKIIILYDLCKLLCLKSPHSYYKLLPTTVIRYMLMNINISLSKSVLYNELIEWIENSPFFLRYINKEKKAKTLFNKNIDIGYGSRGKDALGQATVGAILSEINDMTVVKNQGSDVFDTIYTRMQSRFGSSGRPPLGHLILDSSSQGSESFVEHRIAEKKKKNICDYAYYAFAHWEAKKDSGFYKGETFKVFKGTKNTDPFILEDHHVLTDEVKNNTIEVPIEHKQEFQFNIKKSLRDLAGITTFGSFNYMSSVEVLLKVFDNSRKPNKQNIIHLDFFNQDKLVNYLNFGELNLEQNHTIHIDLGLKNDSTGISSSYISHYVNTETKDLNGNVVIDRKPFFVVDFCLEVRPTQGQEVPIYKIKDFILELRKMNYKIDSISTDGFQSSNIRQDLEISGFNTNLLSVDRTKDPYDLLRDIIFEERIKIPHSDKIIDEFLSLEDTGKKYDHPIGKSKDLIDSICGSIFTKNGTLTTVDKQDLKIFSKALQQLTYNRTIQKPQNIFNQILRR